MKKTILAFATVAAGFMGMDCQTGSAPATQLQTADCTNMQRVKLSDFKDAVKMYGQYRWNLTSAVLRQERKNMNMPDKVDDARCIWFSFDTLQNFLCNIKYYSDKLGIPTQRLGVRIYYGTYNNNHGDYSGLHTLFMVPTFSEDIGAGNTDFDPWRSVVNKNTNAVNGIWTLADLLNLPPTPPSSMGPLLTALGNPNPQNQDLNARNSGDLCPPPQNCNAAVFNKIDQ